MNTAPHRFRVGEFDCAIVSDGTFTCPEPAHVLFANAPQDELARALAEWDIDPADWAVFESPCPSLLIDTGQQKLLVDTGAGGFGPTTGRLIPNLAMLGVVPEDIDVVILTHAHPDHIGGVLDAEGRPAFSKARYMISKAEWAFWDSKPDLAHLKIPDQLKAALIEGPSKNLPPLVEHIDQVEPDTEVVPGIRVIDAAGHTPGQIGVRVTSDDQHLIAISDVAIHPIHLSRPTWYSALDYTPSATVNTRRQILDEAVADQALVFAYHFAAPGLGRIRAEGDAWRWLPACS